jgi:hypothetical protein
MAIHIEAAQEADLNTLASLWRDKMLLADPTRAVNCKSKMAHMTALLAKPQSALLLLAREDAEIVGYISADFAETAIVDDLTLDLHRRSPEAGRLLVNAAIARAIERNYRCLIARLERPTAVERAFWIASGAHKINSPEQGLETYCLTF